MPGIYNFNEKYDAEKFAEKLAKARVKYVNLPCKCNIGNAYYTTKIGFPYPNMKGDMFGDTLKACHARGIGVTAYFNVGLDHIQACRHRDWVTIKKDGTIYGENKEDSFFRTMCYNTPYRDYVKGMIKEVVDNYDIDGIFIDCFDVRPCYGNECVEKMIEEGFDPNDDKDVYEFARRDYLAFCREMKEIVGKDKYFYINGWTDFVANDELLDIDTHSEIEGLPSSLGYEYYATNVAYARTLKDEYLYMTGRFQFSWGDLGGYKGLPSLQNDMWDAIMNGAEFCIGDHLHPAENLDDTLYRDVEKLFGQLEKYEEYTFRSKYVADIAVMTDRKVYEKRYQGIARLLNELKYSFSFVNENTDLSKFKLVILPDSLRLNDRMTEKVNAYLAAGNPVLCVGEGGIKEDGSGFALLEKKHKFLSLDDAQTSYFRVEDEKLCEKDFRWSMYKTGVLFTSEDNRSAIYVKSYFTRHWDGKQCYIYTPPEKDTDYAVVSRSGNIMRICFKLFEAYREFAMKAHKQLVKYCLEELLPDPVIKCEGLPSTARASVTQSATTAQVHIKVTYPEKRGDQEIIEEHQYLPAGQKISILGSYKRAFEPLSGKEIEITQERGYTAFVLPEIIGYMMVVLEK